MHSYYGSPQLKPFKLNFVPQQAVPLSYYFYIKSNDSNDCVK